MLRVVEACCDGKGLRGCFAKNDSEACDVSKNSEMLLC